MADPLAAVARALNRVESAAQAGAAARAALRHVEATMGALPWSIDFLDLLGNKGRIDAVRNTLAGQVANLERVERKYERDDATTLDKGSFAPDRKIINRAYVEAAGAAGLVEGLPDLADAASILASSITEAPSVFLSGVGSVAGYAGQLAGEVTGAAGGAAGNLLWHFVKGAWPVILVAIVGLAIARKLRLI